MAVIDKKLLDHLLDLSRLTISEKEKKKFLNDAKSILDYVNTLNEVDTGMEEPLTDVAAFHAVMRKDEVDIEAKKKNVGETGRIIEAFPEEEGGYLKVPPVF